MSTRIKGWIVAVIFILITTVASIYFGLEIQKSTFTAENKTTEAPTSSKETTVAPSDTTKETTEAPSLIVNKIREIREVTETEIAIIERRYSDEVKTFNVGGEKDFNNISLSAVTAFSELSNEFEYVKLYGDIAEKSCSLYFVLDGDAGYLSEILDVLAYNNMKATFFINSAFHENNPELMERIFYEHHTVASLGSSDPADGIGRYGMQNLNDDTINLHNQIMDKYDYTMRQFLFDRSVYKEQSVALVTQMGYDCCFYTCAYLDGDPYASIDANTFFTNMQNDYHNGATYRLHVVNKGAVDGIKAFLNYCYGESIAVKPIE